MHNHLFCFGFGYAAEKLAGKLLKEGWQISGTTRNYEKIEKFRAQGIGLYLFDKDLPLFDVWNFNTVTHILISITPEKDGEDLVYNYHLEDIKNLKNLQWIGYLSTTGVYGNHNGAWVDENSPLYPNNQRLENRIKAEKLWLESGLPVNIFRLSGIYGPGRNSLDILKNGTAHRIKKDGHYFSRIHVEDIVEVLKASIEKRTVMEVFNVADDVPTEQREVVEFSAGLIGVEPPPLVDFEEANLSEMAREFYSNNKRVKNQKIKNKLGVKLKYPNYKEGLKNEKLY